MVIPSPTTRHHFGETTTFQKLNESNHFPNIWKKYTSGPNFNEIFMRKNPAVETEESDPDTNEDFQKIPQK